MPCSPIEEITFLCTNIENSTGLWEQNPPAMQAALAKHDAILSSTIKAHGGQIFQATGEAFYAVFKNPYNGLMATLESQLAFNEQELTVGLLVRMALHSGKAEKLENTYTGTTIKHLEALQAAAHGGQILVSNATFELLKTELTEEIQFLELGEHRLKDLQMPERIYQMSCTGLSSAFPPLRSLNHLPQNLPSQLNELIGREIEQEKALSLLKQPDSRLITFFGPGGSGKTRLCLQVAAEQLFEFEDGVFLVELENFTQPIQVAAAIATVLKLPESTGRDLIENLKQHIRQRKLLLLLDNFENVLTASSMLEELLASAPGLKVLVTSRTILKIYGEQEFQVAPLALPDLSGITHFNRIINSPAIRLFMERSRQIYPEFQINRENVLTVAEICIRLDGLPLAIELAAARSKDFTLKEMLHQLSEHLLDLTAEHADLPPRHRSIRAIFSWSFDKLNEAEKELFAELSIFAGGCTLDTVGTLADELANQGVNAFTSDWLDMLDGITSLVDKSLLQQIKVSGVSEPRFIMLEIIRELAWEKLSASPVLDTILQSYHAYYIKLALEAEAELVGPEQAIWFKRLEQEHPNYRAIFNYLLFPQPGQTSQPELALQLGVALWRFWMLNNNIHEGLMWLEKGLELLPTGVNPSLRSKADNAAAILSRELGNYAGALAFLEESLFLQKTLKDQTGVATALNTIGIILSYQGDYEKAREIHAECLSLRRELHDKRGIALSLCSLATILLMQRELDIAQSYFEEALLLLRSLQDTRTISLVLNNLGVISNLRGNVLPAQSYLLESLSIQRELGAIAAMANTLISLGELAMFQDQIERAEAYFRESLEFLQKTKNIRLIIDCIEKLAECACARKKPERAAQLFGIAEVLRESLGVSLSGEQLGVHDNKLQETRLMLSDSDFKTNFETGRAMSLQQVLEYLLINSLVI